jgi:hypothetical protein
MSTVALQGRNEVENVVLDRYRGLIARLPVTMRPTLHQQLARWQWLFPYERNRLKEFLEGVDSFQPAAFDTLTQPLRALEVKMGVARWNFSETGDTLENASQLARSEYYTEWRHSVQQISDEIEAAARKRTPPAQRQPSLLVLILPASLPIDPGSAWKAWQGRGQLIRISAGAASVSEQLLAGSHGIAGLAAQQGGSDGSCLWFIDAEDKLNGMVNSSAAACRLNYRTLHAFRDRFLAAVNTIPKNIEATDLTLAEVRRQNWEQWWPAECGDDPRLRNFIIDLFLSGNGALIFSNAFVEWAASEALRRARPQVVVARFGMRPKPKPFTGIAIFENQQRINALPDVDDPEGSAIDAQILARYIWLAASRYPEYEQAHCLCISESLNSAWLIAPPDKMPDWKAEQAVSVEELRDWLKAALSA